MNFYIKLAFLSTLALSIASCGNQSSIGGSSGGVENSQPNGKFLSEESSSY